MGFATLLASVLIFAACEKENNGSTTHERDITYTVTDGPQASSRHDGNAQPTTVHLKTEAEFDALLEQFCDYAEDGSTVTFYNASLVQHSKFKVHNSTKETVTFSTTSREEMKRWMAQMEDEGMTVTVTYDPTTGTYSGTAYATAPQPQMGNGVATFVDPDYGNGLDVIVTIDSSNHTAYVNFDYENYWLHMPCGVFRDIYEEDGRMILAVWESTNGNDTLFVGRNYEGSLMICFAYSGICPANHTHECLLVPAPSDLQTWYCSSPYDIILNLSPYAIETYPEIGIAQICAPMATDINCIPAFWTGNCEMIRYFTNRTDVDYELSLRYTYNNDSSYYVVDSLGVTGYPSDATTAMPMVIHDLHQYPGCASQYVFNRIN